MDYAQPPSNLTPTQIVVDTEQNAGQILPPVTQGRRACIIINRGDMRARVGSDVGIGASVHAGFLLRPGEGIALATLAEIWGTNSTYHVLQLTQ